MKRRPRLMHIIFAEFLFLIGFAMLIPVLPLYGRALGAGATMIGVLLAMNQAVDFFFAPVAGRLSDRFGRKKILIPAMILTVIMYLAVGFVSSFAMLLVVWTIAGLGSAHVLLSQAYVADITGEEERTRGMGLWGASFALAFVVGPPLGAVLFERGGMLAAGVAAGIAAVATIYAAVFVVESRQVQEALSERASRFSAFRHLRDLRRTVLVAIALYFAVIFIWSQFTTILPLYSQDVFGWTVHGFGMYLGAVGVIAAILQGVLVGPIAKRIGHHALVIIGFGLLGGGLAVLALEAAWWTLAISAFGIATGFGLLIPTLPALLSLNVLPQRKGLALGLFQSSSTLARVIAPLLAGLMYDELAMRAPFLFSAVFGLIVMAVTILPRLFRQQ